MSRNLGALTSWNPVGLFRPVMGQLYLYLYAALATTETLDFKECIYLSLSFSTECMVLGLLLDQYPSI
jgi:hypothetical protein